MEIISVKKTMQPIVEATQTLAVKPVQPRPVSEVLVHINAMPDIMIMVQSVRKALPNIANHTSISVLAIIYAAGKRVQREPSPQPVFRRK